MTYSWERTGWFADIDDEQHDGRWPYAPFIQLNGLVIQLSGIWHESEEECMKFIREEIIGQGELRELGTDRPMD